MRSFPESRNDRRGRSAPYSDRPHANLLRRCPAWLAHPNPTIVIGRLKSALVRCLAWLGLLARYDRPRPPDIGGHANG